MFFRESEKEIAEKIIELLESHNSQCIIDVACGTGTLLDLLKTELPDAECIGADFSIGMIETAKKSTSNEILFVLADAHSPPENFYDSADIVICKNAFYHLQPNKAIESFARLAKQDAYLVLTTLMEEPDMAQLNKTAILDSYITPLIEFFSGKINWKEVKYSTSSAKSHMHFQKQIGRLLEKQLPLEILTSLLEEKSFEVRSVDSGHYCGTQYLIIAKKR